MGSQNVDYAQSNADTGAADSASIQPIQNGEVGSAAVFSRPSENLRQRTEVIRRELEDDKYLNDVDRQLTMFGGGSITWDGATDDPSVPGDGKFTLGASLHVKPALATKTCTPAKLSVGSGASEVIIATVTAPYTYLGVSYQPVRAYGRWGDANNGGANKYSVKVNASAGGALAIVLGPAGDPWTPDITITVDPTPTTGTTCDALVAALNANLTFRQLGLIAALGAGAVSGTVIATASFDKTYLSGAVDAEQHVVTAAGLAAFFGVAGNALAVGDVLAVQYPGVSSASGGGRRQSIDEAPENTLGAGANCDNNLFILRLHPDRVAYAIPLCKVLDDGRLLFLEGTAINPNSTKTLDDNSATVLSYDGGNPWADGTTNPATDVAAQLSKFIDDLANQSTVYNPTNPYGWSKISGRVTRPTKDGFTIANTRVDTIVDTLIRILNGSSGSGDPTDLDNDGASRIGSSASAGAHTNLAAGTLKSQILAIRGALDAEIDALAAQTGTPGATHIGNVAAVSGSTTVAAGTLATQITAIVGDVETNRANLASEVAALAAVTGATLVGAQARAGTNFSLAAGTVDAQLLAIQGELDALAAAEGGQFRATVYFTGALTSSGSAADASAPATVAPGGSLGAFGGTTVTAANAVVETAPQGGGVFAITFVYVVTFSRTVAFQPPGTTNWVGGATANPGTMTFTSANTARIVIGTLPNGTGTETFPHTAIMIWGNP